MITDSNVIRTLLKIENEDYDLFHSYCILLDKGLRKPALLELDRFLKRAQKWKYGTRVHFCTYFFSDSQKSNDLDALLTSNLVDQLIEPTLIEMIKQEPFNYLPYKWYGIYLKNKQFLYEAYKINENDNLLNLSLLNLIDESLWYSTHHLPHGYLGNFADDEKDIITALLMIENLNLKDSEVRKEKILDYKKEIEDYKNSI